MRHLKSDKDFKSLKGITFVEIYTNGCLGCTMLKKLIEREEDNYPSISFCDLDIGSLGNFTLPPNIKSLPAMLVFDDGDLAEIVAIDHKKINKSLDALVLKYGT